MIDYIILKTELNTDPSGLGYAAHITTGNESQLAFILNRPRYIFKDLVPISSIQYYIDVSGLRPSLMDAPTNTALPPPVRLAARNVSYILSSDYNHVDFSIPRINLQFLLLASGNSVISSGDYFQIIGMANRTGSRAEGLFGLNSNINDLDISKALRYT
jgi:hypothetical protein